MAGAKLERPTTSGIFKREGDRAAFTLEMYIHLLRDELTPPRTARRGTKGATGQPEPAEPPTSRTWQKRRRRAKDASHAEPRRAAEAPWDVVVQW
jgi:hypothetical protein